MQVKKQQLELNMEHWTGSKLGKEYVEAVYCHSAYLTSMQSTSRKMSGWMKHKLESRFLGEISITSGEGNGSPLQYSCLENPMDGGAWWAAAHGVAKSLTRLSDFTFTFHFHAMEKEMATHSSVLDWRIPGTGEPGGVPSMGLHRVRHDRSDLAAAAAGFPGVSV